LPELQVHRRVLPVARWGSRQAELEVVPRLAASHLELHQAGSRSARC